MMKKLLLGIAVCCGINVNHATNISNGNEVQNLSAKKDPKMLLYALEHDPTNGSTLRSFVDCLVDQDTGEDDTDSILDVICSDEFSRLVGVVSFDKIRRMVLEIAHDWCGGYQRVNFTSYYIDRAINGLFGPYCIPNDPRC